MKCATIALTGLLICLETSCNRDEQAASGKEENGGNERKTSARGQASSKGESREAIIAKKLRDAVDPSLDERQRSVNLDKLVREFTAEEFGAIWEYLSREDTPSGMKRDAIPLVLQRYTELGHFADSFNLAKTLEAGPVRSKSIRGVFSRANVPLGEQLKLRREFENPEDRAMATSGIGPAHHAGFKNDTIDSVGKAFGSLDKLDADEQKILNFRLGSLLNSSRAGGPEATTVALNDGFKMLQSLATSGKIPSAVVGQVLVDISEGDAITIWENSKELFRSVFPEANGIPDNLATNMAFKDAKRTLDLIVENKGSNGMEQSMGAFLANDAAGAAAWLEAHQASLTEPQKQGITKAMAEHALMKGDLAASKEAASQIDDDSARAAILGRIEKQEISQIKASVATDASGTLERLVKQSGGSDNSVLIESALSTWLDADSDAAGKWYLENTAKFSPPQQSAVYSSFARQSIVAGDLNQAEQWAASIPDGDAQMIIRGEIASARRANK